MYITDGKMNLVERIKQIEEIQKKRRENNKLLTYNTGEKNIKSKLHFTNATRKTAGCLAETEAVKQNVARLKLCILQEEIIHIGRLKEQLLVGLLAYQHRFSEMLHKAKF